MLNSIRNYSLNSKREHLISEWNEGLNRELGLSLDTTAYGSRKEAYWTCSIDNHIYKARIGHRTTANSGCPVCSGRKVVKGLNDFETIARKENKEYLLEEWDHKKNTLKPDEITYNSNKKINWKCKDGHTWTTTADKRAKGNNCPKCMSVGTSFSEQYLYLILKDKLNNVKNRAKVNGFEYDIYIEELKLLIEYDGLYYHRIVKNKENKEIEKERAARENGFSFIRIRENKEDIMTINENVIEFKYKTKSNLDRVAELLIDYINDKYNIGLDKEIEGHIEVEAKRAGESINYEDSLEYRYPEIARQWDYESNNGLKPSEIRPYSKMKIWMIDNKGNSKYVILQNRVAWETKKVS